METISRSTISKSNNASKIGQSYLANSSDQLKPTAATKESNVPNPSNPSEPITAEKEISDCNPEKSSGPKTAEEENDDGSENSENFEVFFNDIVDHVLDDK